MRSNKPQSANPAGRGAKTSLMTGNMPKTNNFVNGQQTNYNISAIMKKFKNEEQIPLSKKKDYEVTHMQRNTLLEPNNFIPTWEAGGEERKEVSQTLKALRQKFDKVHKTVNEKQNELDNLKRKLAKTTEEELFLTEKNSSVSDQAQSNKTDLSSLIEEHAFEKLTQSRYEHMLARMKADLISSQLRSQDLKESMKSKGDIAVD